MKNKSYHKQPKTSWDDSYDKIDEKLKPEKNSWNSATSYLGTNPFYTKGSGGKNFILDGIYQD